MIALCFLCLLASIDGTTGHRPAGLSSALLLADASSGQPTTAPESTTRPSLRNDPRAIRWRKTIFWSGVILFVGLVASVAIVRFSRRYAAYLKDEPTPPTSSEDVWSMHRLPLGAIDESKDDGDDGDPDEPPNDKENGDGDRSSPS